MRQEGAHDRAAESPVKNRVVVCSATASYPGRLGRILPSGVKI